MPYLSNLSYFQVAKRFCKLPLKPDDIKTVKNGSDIKPIVTEPVLKAVRNILKKTVITSLWATNLHTSDYKAGMIKKDTSFCLFF